MKAKKTKWFIEAESGRNWTAEGSERTARHTARFWAGVQKEKLCLYRCEEIRTFKFPVVVPKGATPAERKRLTKIRDLWCALTTAKERFYHLPKRCSFSGIGLANEIDKLQKQLDALGDKGPRDYPEVTVEIG